MQMNFEVDCQSFHKFPINIKDKICCYVQEVKKLIKFSNSLFCLDDDVLLVSAYYSVTSVGPIIYQFTIKLSIYQSINLSIN